jgi:hypothetical protein
VRLEQLTGGARLDEPLLAEVDVHPAGETVVLVPDGFAVTEQDEGVPG